MSKNNVLSGCVLWIANGVIILLLIGSAEAEIIRVDDGGGADYLKIQDAIDNASIGDTISIYSGIYYENVNVNKRLILKGGGMPTVNASGSGSAITLAADGISLEGVYATGSGENWGDAGINVISNNNIISNNTASNNGIIGNGGGIWLNLFSNNNTISGNFISNNGGAGIHLKFSSNNTLEYNNASSNGHQGFSLDFSSNNSLLSNTAKFNGREGIFLSGSDSILIKNNIISSNNGNGILLLDSNNNEIVGNNASDSLNYLEGEESNGIFLNNSNYNSIYNNTYGSNTGAGISMGFSIHNSVSNNTLIRNKAGLSLYYSSENTLIGNNASLNYVNGIHFNSSNNNTIINNNISLNDGGIRIFNSHYNTLTKNLVEYSNSNGVKLNEGSTFNRLTNNIVRNNNYSAIALAAGSNNNSIVNNTLTSNIESGIYITSSSNNRIYHNNLIDHITQAYDNTGSNYWNDVYLSGGNYWSDYGGSDNLSGPNQDQSGGDGIGDTPYSIGGSSGAEDRYPFMEQNGWIGKELPDLVVTEIIAPAQVSVRENVIVNWTVKNQGDGTAIALWVDILYISNDTTLDSSDISLFNFYRDQPLASGESYDVSTTIVVPDKPAGDYYLIMLTDFPSLWNPGITESNEDNNLIIKPITIKKADLVVTDMITPTQVNVGETMIINWTVKNQDEGKAVDDWYDGVYLSNDAILDDSDTRIGGSWRYQSLASGESYNVSINIHVPDTPAGDYYLIVKTNFAVWGTPLPESNLDNNILAKPITIKKADLVPTNIFAPAEASVREKIIVNWTVENQGEGQATPKWVDGLYISNDTILDNSDISLYSFFRYQPLASGENYNVSINIMIPDTLAGDYYLIMKTDFQSVWTSGLPESNEDNNIIIKPIAIKKADLVLTELIAPDQASVNENIVVNWTVKNQGDGQAVPQWPDNLYLSNDITLDGSDISLYSLYRYQPLPSGDSYDVSINFNMPDSPAGDYYLIVKTDSPVPCCPDLPESNEDNNIIIKPIAIKKADLVLTELIAPDQASVNENIVVNWTVKNQGEGKAMPIWNDRIYLSNDSLLDDTDTFLNNYMRMQVLASIDSYNISLIQNIPDKPAGDYYLIVKADYWNSFPESREWNNILTKRIVIGKEGGFSEKAYNQSTLTEELLSQKAILNNGNITGDLIGTFSSDFEIVSLNSGHFSGKGFFKGEWIANLEGSPYRGSWEGVSFLIHSERKIFIKGQISGAEASGIAEGVLSESIQNSEVYDRYVITLRLGRIGDKNYSATIEINGNLSYQELSRYPSTRIQILQTSVEGTTFGDYHENLSTVLTHLQVSDTTNPYHGQGFSTMTYTSKSGQGEGWAYNKLVSTGNTELIGMFSKPLSGIIHGTLDETNIMRKISITIERVDLGKLPSPDLSVRIWGPERISPGQTDNFIVEYRNDGDKKAQNIDIIGKLSYLLNYESNTGGGYYDPIFNEITWNLDIPARKVGYFSVKILVPWGLDAHSFLNNSVYIREPAEINPSLVNITFSNQFDNDSLDYTNPPEGVVLAPLDINGTILFIGKVDIFIDQLEKPVTDVNVSLFFRYKNANNSTLTITNSTSNIFGKASFTILGPPGDYSYDVKLRDYDKITETRNFSVNETPFKSFLPFTIIWTNASDANGSYEINKSMNINLSSPLILRAKKEGLKPDSTAEIYLKDSAGITDFSAIGEIFGDEIRFNISNIDEGEYSAVIMTFHPSEITTSAQQTFVFSPNASSEFELNPNYLSIFPFGTNGSNVDFIQISHLTTEDDGNKIVKLINIEPFNSTSTSLTYLIIVNQTMDDTMHLNVSVNGTIIYGESRKISFKEYVPKIIEVYIPINLSITPQFIVSLKMDDPFSAEELFRIAKNEVEFLPNVFHELKKNMNGVIEIFTDYTPGTMKNFFNTNPLIPHTYSNVFAKCIGRFLPGVRDVIGTIDFIYEIKDVATAEEKNQYKEAIPTALSSIGQKSIDPIVKIGTKSILQGGRLGDYSYYFYEAFPSIKNLQKLQKLSKKVSYISNVDSNIRDWENVRTKIYQGKIGDKTTSSHEVITGEDPNIIYGPEGFVSPWQKLNYTIEFENVGEGIAFGVYFSDTLDEDLDASILEIGPVISTIDGSVIASAGTYNPSTRTITWLVGEVGSGAGGYANLSVNVRNDAAEGTEIINYATVYFPSVPETTRTNGIVSVVDISPPRYSNVNHIKSVAISGESVEVSSYWQDGVQLNYTWLETNETGSWQNISYLKHSGNAAWSNFTIQTTKEGLACWRIHANDTAGNGNVTPELCFDVLPSLDTVAPLSVTEPSLLAAGATWLNFTWINPPDADFSHVMLYLNGSFITNVYVPQNFYKVTSLSPDTFYELSTHTVDTSGNINETWVNATVHTISLPDMTPPASVDLLHNTTYAKTYINWTWTDPEDSDFANVSVWIDGVFKDNIQKAIQFYNAKGFVPDTEHTIATRTIDTNGNINQTWKNHTARTASEVIIPPVKVKLTFIVTDNNLPIANVTVQSGGNFKGETNKTGTVTFEVPLGVYKYAVREKGYVRATGTVNVADETTVNVKLTPRK